MTGDSVSEHHRNDLFNHVKLNSRRTTRSLDKEVQCDLADAMDYEVADSGIGGSCELATVTVEINSSPSASASSDTNSHVLSDAEGSTNTSASEHNHTSIIRRESIEKLREQDEPDLTICSSGDIDCATLPVAFRLNNPRLDDSSDGVDDIKEQVSLVPLENCTQVDGKLKELLEEPIESNCALDCLSFTIQCCECTIM